MNPTVAECLIISLTHYNRTIGGFGTENNEEKKLQRNASLKRMRAQKTAQPFHLCLHGSATKNRETTTNKYQQQQQRQQQHQQEEQSKAHRAEEQAECVKIYTFMLHTVHFYFLLLWFCSKRRKRARNGLMDAHHTPLIHHVRGHVINGVCFTYSGDGYMANKLSQAGPGIRHEKRESWRINSSISIFRFNLKVCAVCAFYNLYTS